MQFITNIRKALAARQEAKYAKAAEVAEARLRRLTPDGFDPEDPDDRLMIGMTSRLHKQQQEAKERNRVTAIKKIAYSLMVQEVMSQTPEHRLNHACDQVTKLHYKIAQEIYDSVERVSQDMEVLRDVVSLRPVKVDHPQAPSTPTDNT